jgi:hypothetical protein
VTLQLLCDSRRQPHAPILTALAMAHSDLHPLKIKVMDP